MEKLKKPLCFRYIQAEANVCAYSGEGEEDDDGKKGLETAPSDSSRTTPNFYEHPLDHTAQGLERSSTTSAVFLGTIVGAVKGAKVGAAIGSVVAPPPAGTLVGGAYGGTVGAFVGMAAAGGVAAAHNCVGCHIIEPLFDIDPNKGK